MPTNRLSELSTRYPFPLVSKHGCEVETLILSHRRSRNRKELKELQVIVGAFDDALRLTDAWDDPFDAAAELQRAESLDLDEWFASRKSDYEERFDAPEQMDIHPEGASPMTLLTVGYDHSGKSHEEVFIATVPTSDSTLIPLFLRYGNWNDCPPPHVHVAIARHWKESFGAEIVTLTADVIEFILPGARAPSDEAAAMKLATEQYLYCSDIVEQGVGSIATLAAALRKSTRWYFWWD